VSLPPHETLVEVPRELLLSLAAQS